MKFGTHVSIAGGIENAPLNAAKQKCEVFQIFDRSPRGGKPNYDAKSIGRLKTNCQKFGFKEYYIHAPYYINLASADSRIRHGSIATLRDELEAGSAIGAKYLMFHMGSSRDFGKEKSTKLAIEGINEILKGYKGNCQLLIENSAGSGHIMGSAFEEIGHILKKIKNKNVGVCFDTCHAFASGYDLRDKKAITATFKKFDEIIGLDKLKLFHFNDSKTDLNSHVDRHENIGDGFIKQQGFVELLHFSKINKINAILETPDTSDENCKSLQILKQSRSKGIKA